MNPWIEFVGPQQNSKLLLAGFGVDGLVRIPGLASLGLKRRPGRAASLGLQGQWSYPKALRPHILALLVPKTKLHKAFGLF